MAPVNPAHNPIQIGRRVEHAKLDRALAGQANQVPQVARIFSETVAKSTLVEFVPRSVLGRLKSGHCVTLKQLKMIGELRLRHVLSGLRVNL